MLAIKLQRVGKKHQPSYRLVVAERRSKMAAPPVEDLGAYHPSGKTATFNKDRIAHWIKMGAQPTVTVHNLLVGQEIISAPTMAVKMKKKAAAETAPAATATPTEPAAPKAPAKAAPAATV
jgi:small subunit ribosomal protein S16